MKILKISNEQEADILTWTKWIERRKQKTLYKQQLITQIYNTHY